MSTIFRPQNRTFLHQPFRELGTNCLFQVTTIAIAVPLMPADRSRLPEWHVQENSENLPIFQADFPAKKPNFLAPAIQGAGNELTISDDSHCHWGAAHAFRSAQTP